MKKNKPAVTVQFRMPIELKNELHEYAEKRGLSASDVIRMACIEFMKKSKDEIK